MGVVHVFVWGTKQRKSKRHSGSGGGMFFLLKKTKKEREIITPKYSIYRERYILTEREKVQV